MRLVNTRISFTLLNLFLVTIVAASWANNYYLKKRVQRLLNASPELLLSISNSTRNFLSSRKIAEISVNCNRIGASGVEITINGSKEHQTKKCEVEKAVVQMIVEKTRSKPIQSEKLAYALGTNGYKSIHLESIKPSDRRTELLFLKHDEDHLVIIILPD